MRYVIPEAIKTLAITVENTLNFDDEEQRMIINALWKTYGEWVGDEAECDQ